MATTTTQFPNPTLISGSKRQLSNPGVATASNTKATQAALAVGTLTIQWTPEATTAAAATVPAVNTAWNNIGWETLATLDSLGDGGTTRATSVPVIVSLTAGTAGSLTTTVILYINGVEIGRGSATTAIGTAATVSTVTVAVNAGVTFAAGAKLQMAVYSVLPANVGINAVSYTLNYGTSAATGTNVAPVTYSISAARTGSESTGSTDSARRAIAISKTATDVAPGATDTGSRQSSNFRRVIADGQDTQVDTASRAAAYPRTASNIAPGQVDAASRVATYQQRIGPESTAQVDSAFRAIVKSITASDSLVTVDSAQKTLTFGRNPRHYFVPTDAPIVIPTKYIRGTVYLRADGSVYLGGATVTLVRDDGLECGTTTSSTVDGTYSFVRDALDTNTYSTRIKRETVGGQTEEAVSQSGLVPT